MLVGAVASGPSGAAEQEKSQEPKAAAASQAFPDISSFIQSEKKRYSQQNEELMARHHFRDRRGGFFLDVGAYHWKNFSTTLYLEKHLGWTGISIDAMKELGKGYRKHRPGTKFMNYFVTDHSGGTETLLVAGPLSSQSEEHIRAMVKNDTFKPKKVEVPAITLNDLLDREGVKKVDFLSMDIEMGEPAALTGFDIERFRPDLVCIEAVHAIRPWISKYFDDHGYEAIPEYNRHDIINWYFRPKKR